MTHESDWTHTLHTSKTLEAFSSLKSVLILQIIHNAFYYLNLEAFVLAIVFFFFFYPVTDIWVTTQQLRTSSLDSELNSRILALLFSPVP